MTGPPPADPTAFVQIVKTVREPFGLDRLVMIGDRSLTTSARIDAPSEHPNNTLGWITALRAPAIKFHHWNQTGA